ncbi:dihydroorotate dehydrogenase electron transfer subunit [bacterium]|nr:dihydroorotate dehydrogenase electron transfer subunit [bacterium]
MDREITKVLENRALNHDHRMLVVKAPKLAAQSRPGQFAELATSGATLLRKPISIAMADKEKGTLTFVFRMIGKGTEYLGSLEPSSELDIIGPLGNGFDTDCESALLIGGGVGTPPLLYLASQLKKEGKKVSVVLGARDKGDLLLLDEFSKLGIEPTVATDNGSKGVKGTVVTALEEKAAWDTDTKLYACGPLPMLKALAVFAEQKGLVLEVCMEAYMGCGMGVCVGCTVPTAEGMKRVCKEGPVFNAKEIVWNKIR